VMLSSVPVAKKFWLFGLAGIILLACSLATPMRLRSWSRWLPQRMHRVPWSGESFASRGERIYFTATNEQGGAIRYTGGPAFGGMMMQPRLACVSCHGTDGRGGVHFMHMQVMDAPDIRYEELSAEMEEHGDSEEGLDHSQGEYNLALFRQAVVEGKHPGGSALSADMPRWEMSDEDLAALFEYLKSLP